MTDNDLQILKAARMIIVSASSSIEEGAKSGKIGANGVNNLDLAVEFLDMSHQSLNRVIEIAESHLYPEYDLEDGDRDYPGLNPCPACGNSLPLDAECRCSGCGNG